tara:strand:- start:1523 stop:2020 length:498 start_codon:yes stop_codon:yes gene_type:complete
MSIESYISDDFFNSRSDPFMGSGFINKDTPLDISDYITPEQENNFMQLSSFVGIGSIKDKSTLEQPISMYSTQTIPKMGAIKPQQERFSQNLKNERTPQAPRLPQSEKRMNENKPARHSNDPNVGPSSVNESMSKTIGPRATPKNPLTKSISAISSGPMNRSDYF